jgi:hypothetical protein
MRSAKPLLLREFSFILRVYLAWRPFSAPRAMAPEFGSHWPDMSSPVRGWPASAR